MASNLSRMEGPAIDLPRMTLYQIFRRAVKVRALWNKPAVICQGETSTFSALADRSAAIAATIVELRRKRAIVDSEVIAVFLRPSVARVATTLACLELSLPYLPVDEAIPSKRMRSMFDVSRARILVTTKDLRHNYKDLLESLDVDILELDTSADGPPRKDHPSSSPSETDRLHSRIVPTSADADNPLVCILFTSGSTGEPKAVPLRTSNVLNRLCWYWREFPFDDGFGEVGCHRTANGFVDSVSEVWSCLLQGVPLVVPTEEERRNPESLLRILAEFKVTRLVVVPSLLEALILLLTHRGNTECWQKLHRLKLVTCGSEVLLRKTAVDFFEAFPQGCILANFYGSTEDAGDVTFEVFRSDDDVTTKEHRGCLSIGRPIANTNICILSDDQEVVHEGTEGEICASGPGVVSGYLNLVDQESFLQDVLAKNVIWYRTGDRGFMKESCLYFIGRKDSQIKVRGHRVNLKEIETFLGHCTDVEKIVVLACQCQQSHNVFPVAFVQPVSHLRMASHQLEKELIANCKEHFPEYMLPRLRMVASMPQQPLTGKLDLVELRQCFFKQREEKTQYPREDHQRTDEPMNEKRQALLSILAENLNIDVSELNAFGCSYFELGGNSLSAVSLVVRLREELGMEISVADFVGLSTTGQLVARLNRDDVHDQEDAGRKVSEISPSADLEKLSLTEHQEFAVEILADAFTTKNPLDVLAGTTKAEFTRLMKSFWREILEDDLSFVLKDRNTGQILSATILLDAGTVIQPDFPREEVGAINEAVEAPIRSRLIQDGGRWVDYVLNAVDVTLSEELTLALVQRMEEEVIRVAKTRGYDGIVTVNSHPLTAKLDEFVYGYTVEKIVHVKSYQFRGGRPFADADDDYVIKCMVKRF